MKKNLLSFAVLVLSFCIFTTKTFAQADSGGSAGGGTGGTIDGGGTVGTPAPQPLAIHFTRNNGDGTCGGEAQIRMYYSTAPTASPILNQIYYNGSPLYTNMLPIKGDISNYATTGYVSFCLPTANIPPAIKLDLSYSPTSAQTATISGTD